MSTSAVYSGATLTIPFAAPLTAVTNTKLLLNGTAANIKDLSQNSNLALTNDAKVSNNQTLLALTRCPLTVVTQSVSPFPQIRA